MLKVFLKLEVVKDHMMTSSLMIKRTSLVQMLLNLPYRQRNLFLKFVVYDLNSKLMFRVLTFPMKKPSNPKSQLLDVLQEDDLFITLKN